MTPRPIVLAMIATALIGTTVYANSLPQKFTQHFPDLNPNDTAVVLAADASGNLFIVADAATGVLTALTTHIHVTKTDGAGNVLATLDFGGSSTDTPKAAAVDAQGNLVIVGETQSTDFPLVSALQTSGSIFVTKVDPQLHGILFSTLLGGGPGGYASAVAFDSATNIYVAGSTAGFGQTPAFATTQGALQPSPPVAAESAELLAYGFVAEISSNGRQLTFSTYFAGSGFTCYEDANPCTSFPGSIGPYIYTTPAQIAVDSEGNVFIAGNTNSNNVPVSAGAFATHCNCNNSRGAGFVAELSPGGGQLVWGTYIPIPIPATQGPAYYGGPQVSLTAMTLDASGNVILAGATPDGFPVTAGALQPTYPVPSGNAYLNYNAGFVAELNATGSNLTFATYLGDDDLSLGAYGPVGIAVDRNGVIWVSGSSDLAEMPAPLGAVMIGTNYIAGLSVDGSSVVSFFTAPTGAADQSLAVTSQGAIAALGTSGSLLISSGSAGPYVMGLVELSASVVSPAVCGRELISLYGISIGAANAVTASISNNTIGRSLAGIQVLFNGFPAALLYVGPNQINAIVPSEIADLFTTTVQIVTPAGTINGPTLAVRPSVPQVFTNQTGYAIAVNQDGTINSQTNRAQPGSIVSIWLTGGGAVSGTPDDLVNTTLDPNPLPISVLTGIAGGGTAPLAITYEGNAPTLPSGAIQVNFQLPPTPEANGFPLTVQVGSALAHFGIGVVD